MTNSEKRYSQTEKDALAVHWAKRKFSIYLLGAPKLKIITAHKPFLPMFNKATTRLPPKIEKWVMGMQDNQNKADYRRKIWVPKMNSMIEQIIGHCYACQVATKLHRQEPVKVTDTWDVIVVDFSAPYPDGHYNLMAMKKRTRYPEVAKTHSTTSKPTMEKLKTMFATHGT